MERWFSANSVCLTLLSGKKPYSLQASMYILPGVVNTFILVEPAFLTSVPERVRTNCKLMWVVKKKKKKKTVFP